MYEAFNYLIFNALYDTHKQRLTRFLGGCLRMRFSMRENKRMQLPHTP